MSFSSATAGINYPTAGEVLDFWQQKGFEWGKNRVSRFPTWIARASNPVTVFFSTLLYSSPAGEGSELPIPSEVLSPGQMEWVNAAAGASGVSADNLAFHLALQQKNHVLQNPGVVMPDAMYDQAVDNAVAFAPPTTPEAVAQAEREVQDLLERPPTEDPDPEPRPLPIPLPGPRVTQPRCKVHHICFMPRSPLIKLDEFVRQMKLQEAALNRMTPQQMLANHTAYRLDPAGMRALSDPLQHQTRAEYEASVTMRFRLEHGRNWEAALADHMSGLAALHNPDMIAGGHYASVADPGIPLEDRMGGLNENSSMGRQWQDREARLVQHAREQAANGCPSVQVSMNVCASVPGMPGQPR
ncbi:polymorphic toxin type 15 domain-containing protein [Mesorhizobium sp. CAU 1732]|uniref:polymorphic toxin type 15 domain-containing protein n=1 Tax=Mesorhizobium sp. CAU 1732 TaxID=3140358 RepID=UPI00326091CF